MDTSRVHLGPVDGGTDAFVAWPAGKATGAGVIVVHEWWGLNAQIRSVAQRLAQQGYVAIVPDLYHGKVAGDPEQAHILMRGVDTPQAMADLDAAAAWLRFEPRVGKRKVGVIGFCMGGMYTLQFALHSAEPAAAVMFYGPPETDPEKLAALKAPLMGHFGATDDGIPTPKVEAFKSSLQKLGKPAEIFVYTGAGHAFMNDTRPSYQESAAKQAWKRTLEFLQKNLKS